MHYRTALKHAARKSTLIENGKGFSIQCAATYRRENKIIGPMSNKKQATIEKNKILVEDALVIYGFDFEKAQNLVKNADDLGITNVQKMMINCCGLESENG